MPAFAIYMAATEVRIYFEPVLVPPAGNSMVSASRAKQLRYVSASRVASTIRLGGGVNRMEKDFYYVNEIPPPRTITILTEAGKIDTSYDGLIPIGKAKIQTPSDQNDTAETDVPCSVITNGTFQLNFNQSSTIMTTVGTLLIHFEMEGKWFLTDDKNGGPLRFPVRNR